MPYNQEAHTKFKLIPIFLLGCLFSLLTLIIPIKLSVLAVLSIIFIIFTFINLQLSLSLFLFGCFIVPHELWNNLYLFFATTLYILIYFIKNISSKPKIKINSISSALLIFTSLAVLSLVTSYDIKDSLRMLILLLSGIFMSMLISLCINTKQHLNQLIFFLLLSMVATSLYGIYQYKTGIAIRLDFIDVTMSSGVARLYSTMDNPNNFAEFLLILLPVSTALIFNCKNDTKRLLLVLLMSPCFLALVLTSSRSAYIAVVLSVAVFVYMSNRRLVPFLAILCIALIPLIPSSIINRLLTIGKDSSSKYRLLIWTGALKALAQNWIYGIGIGPSAFAKIFRPFVIADVTSAMHSHNLLLQVWLEMGIFAFISFIAFIFSAIKTCFVNVVNKEFKYYFCAFISALVGILVMSMVEQTWFYPRVMYTFWILMGLIFATKRISRSSVL